MVIFKIILQTYKSSFAFCLQVNTFLPRQAINPFWNLATQLSYTGIYVYWQGDLLTYFTYVSRV